MAKDLKLGPDFGSQLASVHLNSEGLSALVASTFAKSIHPAGQQPGGYHLASQLAEKVVTFAQADPSAADKLLDWVLGATSGPHTGGPEDIGGWARNSYVGPAWQGSEPYSLRSTNGRQAYIVEHILARYKAIWDDLDHVTSEPQDWDQTSKRNAQARLIFGPTLLLASLFNIDQFRAQAWGVVEDILRRVALTSAAHSTAGYLALATLLEVSSEALDKWTCPAPKGEGVCGWGTQWLEIYGVVQNPFERWTFSSACAFVASPEWAPSEMYLKHMPGPVRRLFDEILTLAKSWVQSKSHPTVTVCAEVTKKYEWLLHP